MMRGDGYFSAPFTNLTSLSSRSPHDNITMFFLQYSHLELVVDNAAVHLNSFSASPSVKHPALRKIKKQPCSTGCKCGKKATHPRGKTRSSTAHTPTAFTLNNSRWESCSAKSRESVPRMPVRRQLSSDEELENLPITSAGRRIETTRTIDKIPTMSSQCSIQSELTTVCCPSA
jgi:hypothetical protein